MKRALGLGWLVPSLALAHSAGLGTATVREEAGGAFAIQVRLPAQAPSPQVRAPGCAVEVFPGELAGAAVVTRVLARCPEPSTLALEVGKHPLIVRWAGTEPRVLEEAGGWVELPLRPKVERAHFPGWLREGVGHILGGVDHLLFLLGLCLLGARKKLLAQVTTFTVAHSLSLGLAAFGLVRLPVPPVEACIALSVAWVGWAAMRRRPEGTWVVFAFGLLHGMGFASALDATGLPTGTALGALLGFNLGVEAGQLAVLLGLVPLVAWLDRSRLPLRFAVSGALGVVGVAWTLERVAGFWGPV